MKREECSKENYKKNKNKKIAIGATVAGTAALVGAGLVLKSRKNKKDKQAK